MSDIDIGHPFPFIKNRQIISEGNKEMTYVTTGRTLCSRSVVNVCHRFFCFNVMFLTDKNFLFCQ